MFACTGVWGLDFYPLPSREEKSTSLNILLAFKYSHYKSVWNQ
jgi:hypothetical protein